MLDEEKKSLRDGSARWILIFEWRVERMGGAECRCCAVLCCFRVSLLSWREAVKESCSSAADKWSG